MSNWWTTALKYNRGGGSYSHILGLIYNFIDFLNGRGGGHILGLIYNFIDFLNGRGGHIYWD